MKVSHRLYLASVPAVLGVLAVAALAYWGQYARTVPELLLVIAAVAAVGTLVMAWTNVRYVAQRVERLAGVDALVASNVNLRTVANAVAPGSVPGTRDELDVIESAVSRLSNAVELAESDRVQRERTYEQRARDYAHMLSFVTERAASTLEEVRLPLHILLDNHFGEMNENQEELLGAARAAAERVDSELMSLKQIADLDLGSAAMRLDRVIPADVVRAILPTLKAAADRAGVALQVDIEPLVPAVRVNQAALQEALSNLLVDCIGTHVEGAELSLTLARNAGSAQITLSGIHEPDASIRLALARRTIAANNGVVTFQSDSLSVALI